MGGAGWAVGPRVERFCTPSRFLMTVTTGLCRVTESMSTFPRSSGRIFTPTSNAAKEANGPVPNVGSSMTVNSATLAPTRGQTVSRMSSKLTFRFSAFSMRGR